MSMTKPLKHDDIPFQSFPRKYQMINNWTIPKIDLKYLRNGPLINNEGTKIIVKYQNGFKRIISLISQIRPLSWILSFAFVCQRYWEEILEIWEKSFFQTRNHGKLNTIKSLCFEQGT